MIYRDAWQMPVTKEMDGGDSAAIVGSLLALDPKAEWSRLVPKLFPQDLSTPVRHPNRSKWYGMPNRFTRDQMIPLLCAFIQCRHKSHGLWIDCHQEAVTLFKMHKAKWFLRAWNLYVNARYDTKEEQQIKDPGTIWVEPHNRPDVTGPEIWSLWIRLWRHDMPWHRRWIAWIILNILDLETLGGSIVWMFKSKSNRVTRNHMLVTITSRKFWPTITSRINWELADFAEWLKRWSDHCEAVGESNTAPYFDKVLKEMGR